VDQPLLSWGAPDAERADRPDRLERPERADAVRNRRLLLAVARDMLAEQGADKLTMDGLADRAGLGKGTVFRRFGTRAGIFQALLDEEERAFQEQVLYGPPPLGPGAPPLDRLIAYGRARASFMVDNHEIARAALDSNQPRPAGAQTPISQVHIRMLLGQMDLGPTDLGPTDLGPTDLGPTDLGPTDLGLLAVQLTAALDGPLLLYLSGPDLTEAGPDVAERIAQSWKDLIRRVCRP
jgi:AcrR family transcriptional regulator